MKADITTLPVGTKFQYKNEQFVVEDRGEYPFIVAKCLTEPNAYEGLGLMFTNFEQVEVADGTPTLPYQAHIVVER